jgi:LacI family transcriptional regulator
VPPAEEPPTLAKVAASAGVSIATVSKVVNGRSDVGPATRERVENLLEEHRYVARRAETTVSSARGRRTVELVFHGPSLSVYSLEIIQGVLEAGTEAGVSIAVSVRPRPEGSPRGKRSAGWVRKIAELHRAAIIDVVDDVREGDLTALIRSRLPLVVIDPLSLPRREVTSVGTTNFSGGLAAVKHLLALGHRRIAYVGAKPGVAFNQARMHGYRAALEDAGVAVPPGYVQHGDFSYDAGVAAGAMVLDLPEPPTAIFAATDESAAGVIEAARIRGLRIPENLSVVGFDDTAVARLLSPPLTTIRQPLREMGRMALRAALRLADGEQLESHHVELATSLVLRGSTGPPPACRES